VQAVEYSGERELKKPITGIDGCCACAANGQAAAVLSAAINLRRSI
jgi:hypothetical protein